MYKLVLTLYSDHQGREEGEGRRCNFPEIFSEARISETSYYHSIISGVQQSIVGLLAYHNTVYMMLNDDEL